MIFAFSPHRLEHFDHLELQFAFWIPLAALAWHRAVERRTLTACLLVSAAAAGQILSSIYHGMFLLTWLAFVTAVWFARSPRQGMKAAAAMLLPALVVLAVYSMPYFESRKSVGERSRTEVAGYSAKPLDFLSAPANNRLYGWTDSWGENERRFFPGLAAAMLLGIGLWRGSGPIRLVYGAGLGLAIVLTLGFNGGLYTLLYDWVLPFRALRVPARAGILILLSTAVLAGAGLAWLLARLPSRRARLALAATAICAASIEFVCSPAVDRGRPTHVAVVWLAAHRAGRGGVRVARHRPLAPAHHAGRHLHVPVDGSTGGRC